MRGEMQGSGHRMAYDTTTPAHDVRLVALASDHAGVDMKGALRLFLETLGYSVLDLGPCDPHQSVDYPDYADAMAGHLTSHLHGTGILLCGSGIGISIAANRHRHVRAALCHSVTEARLARQHNDANVLALGARIIGLDVAKDCVRTFMETAFEGGRHARRVAMLDRVSGP
jgi:ribose 5-phosphate isomerase B